MKPSDHIAELEQRLAAVTDECAKLRARIETLDKQRRQLEQVRRQWTATLDAVKDPVFMHDDEFRIIRANAAYAGHAGMRVQDTIGKPYWQVFPKRSEPLPGCHRTTRKRAGDTDEVITLESGRQFHSRSFCQTEQGEYHCTHILEDVTDKLQLQEELRQEQEQTQQYLEVAGVILLLLGRRGNVQMINRMGCEILGLAKKDILGKNWFDHFLPEKNRKEVRKVFDRLIAGDTETVEFYESPVLCMGGRERLIAWHNVLIRDRHGEPAFVLSSGNDITEFRQSQEAARISEQKFRMLFDTIGDAVFIHDMQGQFLEVNQTACERLGYSREELLNMNLDNINTVEFTALISEQMGVLLQHGKNVFEAALLCRDKTTIPVEVNAHTLTFAGEPAIISVVRDISERKLAEEALRQSEEMYRSLFENMLNGFAHCQVIFDAGKPVDFIYLNVNAAFEAQTGLKNVIGKKVTEVIPGIRESDPGLFELYGRVALSGKPERFEVFVEALQEWFWISVYSPQQEHFVAVFDVITERKQAEEALKKNEALLSEMGRIAHIGGWEFDPQSGHGSWTEEVARIHGMEPDEPTSLEIGLGFYRGESRQKIEAAVRAAIEHGTSYDLELEMVTARGSQKWVRAIARPIAEAGKVVRVAGSFQDITERKLAERALRVLSAVNEALVRASDENKLLRDICRAIVVKGGYRMSWVGYAEKDESRTIRPVAHAGHEDGYLRDVRISWADDEWGHGPVGAAVRTGKTSFVQHIDKDPTLAPWQEQAVRHGFASIIALPLAARGKAFGVLCIYADTATAFTEEEVDLLEEMAGDLAYGIKALRTSNEHKLQRQALEENQIALKTSLVGTVNAAARLIEARDPYTAGHQMRVAQLSVAIARELGWEQGRIEGLQLGAIIHDIGKIKIPADILSKPGRLTAVEFELIKSHPGTGYEILRDVAFPWPVASIVHQHHERIDGSGYPHGLKGDQIIEEAKIVAVADVVEAMSSHRPYRAAKGMDAALEEIEAGRGIRYDAEIADACLRLIKEKGLNPLE